MESGKRQSLEDPSRKFPGDSNCQLSENKTDKLPRDSPSKTAEKPTSQPLGSANHKAVTIPTSQSEENTTNHAVESTTNLPVESPSSEPAENTTNQAVESTTNLPVESSSSEPAENTTNRAVESTTNLPVESPSSEPAENTTNQAVERTTNLPVESSRSEPAENTTKRPADNSVIERLTTLIGDLCEVAISWMLNSDHPFHLASRAVGMARESMNRALLWLPGEPLWQALQASHVAAADECPTCSPVGRLSVLNFNHSGSSPEGLDDLDGIDGRQSTSDMDVMMELGPCRWLAAGDQGNQSVSSDAVAGCCPDSSPQLLAVPSTTPGFYVLLVEPTAECRHTDQREFPAYAVRQLVQDWCTARHGPDVKIKTAGPAVNINREGAKDGGVDMVPCIRMPVWPAEEFRCRQPVTDFPPAKVREDICRFGVHLVPTGPSCNELIKWRLSFSRAEIVVGWHMSPIVRVAVKGLKNVKNIMQASEDEDEVVKNRMRSYHIKTAALWLYQDTPRESWTTPIEAMRMILDWLKEAVNNGRLPCFFWAKINLLAEFSADDLDNMRSTIAKLRERESMLLHLLSWYDTCLDLKTVLECAIESGSEKQQPGSERQQPGSERQQPGSERQQPPPERPEPPSASQQPLSASQQPPSESLQSRSESRKESLQLFIARQLIMRAVVQGIRYRPSAPYWKYRMRQIPAFLKISAELENEWAHHSRLGTYDMHRYLLQAMFLTPDELVGGAHLTSQGGGIYTWSAAPLLAILTESDMRRLLGDPAAVGSWVRQQLSRPPAERPEGLTAELDTPQGRVDLLLNSDLLVRAYRETGSEPAWATDMKIWDEEWAGEWWELKRSNQATIGKRSYDTCDMGYLESQIVFLPYEQLRQELVESLYSCDMEQRLYQSPYLNRDTVTMAAKSWKLAIERLLTGTSLRTKYDAIIQALPDWWQLRQFPFGDNH